MNDYSKLEKLAEEDYRLNISDYLNKSFNVFGKYWVGFVGFYFLLLLIGAILSFIPAIGAIVNFIISAPLSIGFYIVAHKIYNGGQPEFNDFFKGFDKLGELILAALVTGLIVGAVMIPAMIVTAMFFITAMSAGGSMPGLAMFLILVVSICPAIYFGITYAGAGFFIYFHDLPFWDAMKMSKRFIDRKWFSFFGFFILLGLIVIAGLIVFLVGLLAAIPIVSCALYFAFADISRLNELGEKELSDDHLIDHLVD